MTKKRHCAICNASIPKKNIDDLTDEGYCKMAVKKEDSDGIKLKMTTLWFCPEHTVKEILSFVAGPFLKSKGVNPLRPLTRSEAVEI